jgi:hypothetical protein
LAQIEKGTAEAAQKMVFRPWRGFGEMGCGQSVEFRLCKRVCFFLLFPTRVENSAHFKAAFLTKWGRRIFQLARKGIL